MSVVTQPVERPLPHDATWMAWQGWRAHWPLACAALLPSALIACASGTSRAGAVLLVGLAACIGWQWRTFSGPIRPDAARIELGMAAVGLLWAVATLAVYSQLPTSAAALHLVLLGAAGGLGLASALMMWVQALGMLVGTLAQPACRTDFKPVPKPELRVRPPL